MATTLGKRKRRGAEITKDDRSENGEDSGSLDLDAQEIFRRHFEAQFKPLAVVKKPVKVVDELSDNESDEESEWDGISDSENESVKVVEHVDAQSRTAAMSKEELKAFMVSHFAHLILRH